MKTSRFDRRTILGSLAGLPLTAGLLPFVPRDARAAGAAPKRVLFAFFSMGFLEEYFWPAATQTNLVQPGTSTQNFTLGDSMAALSPYKNKLILIDGINNFGIAVSNPNYRICDNGHGKGIKMIFTGGKTLANDGKAPANANDMACSNDLASGWQPADGPSLDHVIAEAIGKDNLFRNIHLGVGSDAGTHKHAFWKGSNQPITAEMSPAAAFDRLFGNLSSTPEETARLTKLRARRQSVIDMVRGDLNTLKGRLGTGQRVKIDNHLDAVRALETRLQDVRAFACTKPGRPPIQFPASQQGGQVDAAIKAQIDVLVGAFACDLTRVAGLQIGHADSGPIPDGVALDRHAAAHAVSTGNPDRDKAIDSYRKTDAFYASHLAYLCKRLAETPEDGGNGQTMLDNTLIVYGTDTQGWLREGGTAHASTRFPTLLAGGGNFAFPTGRYIKVSPYKTAGASGGDDTIPSQHRVLVAVARKFGLPINTFGSLDPAVLKNRVGGPLPEL